MKLESSRRVENEKLDVSDFWRRKTELFLELRYNACLTEKEAEDSNRLVAAVERDAVATALKLLGDAADVKTYRALAAKLRDAEAELAPLERLAAKTTAEIGETLTGILSGSALAEALSQKQAEQKAAVEKVAACRDGLAMLRAAKDKAKVEVEKLVNGACLAACSQEIANADAAKKEAVAKLAAVIAESGALDFLEASERANLCRAFQRQPGPVASRVLAALLALSAVPPCVPVPEPQRESTPPSVAAKQTIPANVPSIASVSIHRPSSAPMFQRLS